MNFYRCIKGPFLFLSISLLLHSCSKKSEDAGENNVFENAAVVSAHPVATNIGVEVLKNGGNAFDAAIAVQFALAVVYPGAGNIGGGGFAVLLDSKGNSAALDFREKAPSNARRDMYLDSAGLVIPGLSTEGALAAGVPGSVMGMWELHKKYGKTDWKELIRPSIEIARKGWELTEKEAAKLNSKREDILRINKTNNYLTLQDNYEKGDSLKNTDLAETLDLIAENGADGFYKGDVASAIESTMVKYGGIMNKQDLEEYEAVWREPIKGEYNGYEVISMPPPSSGGWALISMLRMAEYLNLGEKAKWDIKTIHSLCAIEKRVYADRSKYLGDSDFYPVPLNELLDQEYLIKRANSIKADIAQPADSIQPGLEPEKESTETTHFSIVDEEGNAIAVTTTLNTSYGNKLVVEGAGFLLNNEMDDFSSKPGYPNFFGLIGGEANAIEAGKRMLSSMTPTIIAVDGKAQMVIGSPGGSRIITSVLQNIMNVLDYGYGMQESVNLPRYHHQWRPDSVYFEDGFFEFADSLRLSEMGYLFKKKPSVIGRVDAILKNADGQWECGADPRGDDYAYGY